MAIIWVYEYRYDYDNDYNIYLYASVEEARSYAIVKIDSRLRDDFNADDFDSDHHETYVQFRDYVNSGRYREAINHYNEWVGERDSDEQIYYSVYSREVIGTEGVSVISTTKSKVQFTNGADCKKCHQHNEFVAEANQDDGTYLCGTCKALGGVFG